MKTTIGLLNLKLSNAATMKLNASASMAIRSPGAIDGPRPKKLIQV